MNNYSNEHKLYLKNLKKKKLIVFLFRISIIILFIILWEVFSRTGLINSFLFSSPSRVLKTICELIKSKTFFKHIGITLFEVIVSFSLSNILGFIISIILLWSNTIYKIFDPYITILNSLPKVALGPLIIIWVGASINSIIFMALLISVFVTIINIYNGFVSVNKNYIIMLKSFGANKIEIFFKVILPSSFYNIISSEKVNISMNLIGVIMGELLVSKRGIGYLIMYGSQIFNIDLVITGVVILGIISYLMYMIIEKIEGKNKEKFS